MVTETPEAKLERLEPYTRFLDETERMAVRLHIDVYQPAQEWVLDPRGFID